MGTCRPHLSQQTRTRSALQTKVAPRPELGTNWSRLLVWITEVLCSLRYLHPLSFLHFSWATLPAGRVVADRERVPGVPGDARADRVPLAPSRRGHCRDFSGACRPGTSRLSRLVLCVNGRGAGRGLDRRNRGKKIMS